MGQVIGFSKAVCEEKESREKLGELLEYVRCLLNFSNEELDLAKGEREELRKVSRSLLAAKALQKAMEKFNEAIEEASRINLREDSPLGGKMVGLLERWLHLVDEVEVVQKYTC